MQTQLKAAFDARLELPEPDDLGEDGQRMHGYQWLMRYSIAPVATLVIMIPGVVTVTPQGGGDDWGGNADAVESVVHLNAMPEDSAELYLRHCASCHGKGGEGDGSAAAFLNPQPPDLTTADGTGQLTDEELLDVITNGRKTMPGFAAMLQPEELRALAAFVRSLERG